MNRRRPAVALLEELSQGLLKYPPYSELAHEER